MRFQNASRGVVCSFATIVVLAVSFFVPVLLHAQAAGATLSGNVTDPSSATIPNANVSIKNIETGISRDVTTNEAGFYNAPNLSPGIYEVSASAPGFSKLVQTNITLTVGAQQALNLSLQVGEVTQTVEVPGEPPNVELTSSAVTAEVNSLTVRELPLNGRDWSSLAVLQPGTIGIRTQIGTTGTVNRGNRGFGNQLSISGHRPTENNYRVNGVSVNDYSNGSPGSVQGAQLGVDAIQEFSVLTANYTAEYGRTSGGVINAITKPGTNDFHGTAYWFLRDEGLDTKSFFATQRSPFHRNQFGGSAGGPLQKDKTFVFGDFEAIRQSRGLNSVQLNVPSPAARGIGPNGQPTVAVVNGSPLPASGPNAAPNPDPTTHIDRSVLPYLAFYPLPNAGVSSDTGLFVTSPVQQYSQNYATARLDHKFSDKDTVDFVWFFDRSPQITPDAFLESTTQTFRERNLGEIEETHVFSSSFVNTARFGYNRTNGLVGQPVNALLPLAADATLGVVPNRPAPILGVNGLGTAQGSLGSQTRNNHTQNSYQFYDDAFVTRGSHALKFGFSVEGIQYNELSVQRPNGTFNFDSLASLLTNRPTNFILGDPNNSIELGNRIKFFGVYFQDDWHVRSNLTLNLGFRYEPGTLPKEAQNRFTVVTNIFGGRPTAVPSLYRTNPTLKNFEPRVGFAWDPFHNGKTSVRGGFGIFDVLPGPWESNIQESGSFPFAQTVSAGNLAAGAFPRLTGVVLGANSFQAYAPEQNPKTNYALNWNLNIQREITRTLTATIGYVGSHTVHSPFTTDDSNQVLPTRVAGLGDLFPCGAPLVNGRCTTGGGTIIDPNVGQLRPTFYAVNARYNVLEAQLRKNLSHGLQLQGSYTWSKCYDNSSSGDIGDPYQNSLSSLPFFASLDRLALCDFNITHNFVGNWIWDVPSPKSTSGIKSRLEGGWELGGIITASTGSPFTPVLAGDPLGQNSSDPFAFPNRVPGCNPVAANYRTTLQYLNLSCFTPATAPASFTAQCANFTGAAAPPPSGTVYCRNLFGNSGRNSVIGPGLFDWDFSIYKNNYFRRISESFNVQFRAEFFNVLNHTNFQSPIGNSVLFRANGAAIPNAGVLDTVSTDPREIQLTLKAIW
jgi:hypothetical protein